MRGRVNQPDPTFPQLPGIILEISGLNLSTAAVHLSSFNELRTSYRNSSIRQSFDTHSLFTKIALGMIGKQVIACNKQGRFSHS
jgi:hypothetical protein